MRLPLVAAFGAALTGCASPDNAPARSIEVPGDYQTVADCFYSKQPIGLRLTHLDSQKRVEVAYEAEGARFASIDFISAGANRTRVETRAAMSIFGRDANASGFEPRIRACSQG